MEAMNDHERAQLLRQWWQENGMALMLGLGLAIAAVLGWQFFQGYRDQQAATASGVYEDLQDMLLAKDMTKAATKADQLETEYSRTAYAALGDLALGRALVESGKTADAVKRLQWVVEHSSDEGLRALGILRLSRALWANQQLDAALAELDKKLPSGFSSLASELRGDILQAQGKRAEAHAAYEQALQTAAAMQGEQKGKTAAGRDGLRRKLADTQ